MYTFDEPEPSLVCSSTITGALLLQQGSKVNSSSCPTFVGSNHRFVRDIGLFLRPAVATTVVRGFSAACLFPGLPYPAFCFQHTNTTTSLDIYTLTAGNFESGM